MGIPQRVSKEYIFNGNTSMKDFDSHDGSPVDWFYYIKE